MLRAGAARGMRLGVGKTGSWGCVEPPGTLAEIETHDVPPFPPCGWSVSSRWQYVPVSPMQVSCHMPFLPSEGA